MSDAVKDSGAGTGWSRSSPSRRCSSRREVRMDATLEDLGIDSLGLVEAIFAIEEAFDIQVPFNANDPQKLRVRHQHRRHHGARGGEPDRGRRTSVAAPRVVITGQGAINALGRTAGETMAGDARGPLGHRAARVPGRRAAVDRHRRPDPRLPPEEHFGRQELTLYDPFTQFALLAAREAMAQSGLEIDRGAERARGRGARHLGRRAADPGRELPAGLPGGEEPGASLRGAAADEQRRRQPRLDGARTCRARATRSRPPAPRRTTRWGRR